MIRASWRAAMASVASVEPESTMRYSSSFWSLSPDRTRSSVLPELKVRMRTEMEIGSTDGVMEGAWGKEDQWAAGAGISLFWKVGTVWRIKSDIIFWVCAALRPSGRRESLTGASIIT